MRDFAQAMPMFAVYGCMLGQLVAFGLMLFMRSVLGLSVTSGDAFLSGASGSAIGIWIGLWYNARSR
jgi:hypothetical protein